MLPFENAKLLPKSKVFDEQVAARAKEASGHDRKKPQQEHHETSFARVHAKAATQPTYLIRQQIAILASHRLENCIAMQGQMRVIEDRARRGRELLLACRL
jgi:hypothetical protein